MIDFYGINASVMAAYPGILYSWLPGGKLRGHEYICGSISGGPGESTSVNTTTGKWADFSTDAKGGDPVSLYAAIRGIDQSQSAKDLDAMFGVSAGNDIPNCGKPAPVSQKTPIIPVPADAPAMEFRHPRYGAPTKVWPYHVAEGLAGYAARFDFTSQAGKAAKDVLPVTYCDLGNGRCGWRARGLPEPRPLYRLLAVISRADDPVLVCEGEKSADAAASIFPDVVATTPMHGAKSPQKTDWSILHGRNVTIWPDNDNPGRAFAKAVASLATKSGAMSVRIVDIPHSWPSGWDVADIPPDGADLGNMLISAPLWRDESVSDPDPEPYTQDNYVPPVDAEEQSAVSSQAPIPLGYDHGVYYYLSQETRQIEVVSADRHNESVLSHLASVPHYWERTRFVSEKGVNWKAAADALRTACKNVGIYDPSILRGRGCWFDQGRAVLHLGHEMIVDGQRSSLMLEGSRYVYERARTMDIFDGPPLKNAEAKKLADLCTLLNFESEDMAILFCGWMVIAPVCSALKQRPHLWLSGSAGSGKSWIVDHIVGPLMSGIAVRVASKTTEAGIRGELKSDGRPILFDEAETQSMRDRDRMQLVLDLARQAYSEDCAAIAKGTQTGGSIRYNIRSSFFFSSINTAANQSADESRIISIKIPTITDMSEEGKFEQSKRFAALKSAVIDTITSEFAGRLLARTMGMLETLRLNAAVYAEAISEIYGSRRQGDTIGAAMAGYTSLHHTRAVTISEARAFVSSRSWVSDAITRTETAPDHEKALEFLMEQPVRTMLRGSSAEIPMMNLIAFSVGMAPDDTFNPGADICKSVLLNVGVKISDDFVWFAMSHSALSAMFEKTPWGASWPNTLLQTPGSTRSGKTLRFGHATKRGLGIPIGLVIRG